MNTSGQLHKRERELIGAMSEGENERFHVEV